MFWNFIWCYILNSACSVVSIFLDWASRFPVHRQPLWILQLWFCKPRYKSLYVIVRIFSIDFVPLKNPNTDGKERSLVLGLRYAKGWRNVASAVTSLFRLTEGLWGVEKSVMWALCGYHSLQWSKPPRRGTWTPALVLYWTGSCIISHEVPPLSGLQVPLLNNVELDQSSEQNYSRKQWIL